MAITVTKRPESDAWGSDSGTMLYVVAGTDDFGDARDALAAEAPAAARGLARRSVNVVGIGDPTETLLWDGTAQYGQPGRGPLAIGDVAIRVQVGGGTRHTILALEHVADYAPEGETAPNHNGFIGVTPDGAIEGVDVESGSFEFTVTKVFDKESYPDLANLYALRTMYPVNDDEFSVTDSQTGLTLTFQAGECRFRGADVGAARSDEGLEITYQFAAEPNAANFVVSGITVAEKKGWDYLWPETEWTVDAEAKRIIMRPVAVHIERVYGVGDFSVLGL